MLSIIVPVYNGMGTAGELAARISSILLPWQGDDWELLFIDDGSTDGSLELIKQLAMQDSHIGWVSLAHNAGQQAAVLCGLRESRGELIVTMDDDLQHPVEVIPALLNELNKGFDAVYAVPDAGGRSGGGLRDLFFTVFLKKPAGLRIGSYRIFTRAAADLICRASQPFVYISAELFSHGLTAGAITYTKAERDELPGLSRYSFMARLRLYLKLLRWYMPFKGKLFRRRAGTQYSIAGKGGCL